MAPLVDKKGRPIHNPIRDDIDTFDKLATDIAARSPGSKAKKREILFDHYMRAGLTRQQAARRIERILGKHGIGAPSARSIVRPAQIDSPSISLNSKLSAPDSESYDVSASMERRYGQAQLRDKQASFRRLVLNAYSRTCAITGCRIEEILTAAHITPHSDEINYDISNGICLRIDVHILFDRNLIRISPDYTIEVSENIRDRDYRAFHGRRLRIPSEEKIRPSRAALNSRTKVVQ